MNRQSIANSQISREQNLTTKRSGRPGSGMSPMSWFDVVGRAAAGDFREDELIEL